MAADQVKVILEKELTCPLCMDVFKQPKKLPCDHVYCKDCLHKLALRSLNAVISCPECRSQTSLPDGGVSQFQTDFRLNRLIEAFQKVRAGEKLGLIDLNRICPVHRSQPLALYCENCKKQLCRDCVLKTNDHASHEYGFFKDVAENYRTMIQSDFEKVRNQNEPISRALKDISAMEKYVERHTKDCQDSIDRTFEELISALQECRDALKGEANTYYNSIKKIVRRQREELEEARDQLCELSTTVEAAIKECDPEFLNKSGSLFKSIDHLKYRLPSLSLKVGEPQLLAVNIRLNKETLKHYLKSQCFLYKPVNPNMCVVEGSFLTNAQIDKQGDLMITLMDSQENVCQSGENLVEVDLLNYQGKPTKGIKVMPLSPGQTKVALTPESRGVHKLHVKVNGSYVKGSPFSIKVNMPLKMYSKPVDKIPKVQVPVGLSYSNGKVIATEVGQNRFIEISSTNPRVRGLHHLIGVNKLTQDSNFNTYATTLGDNKLHKLNKRWEHVRMVGQYGKGNAEFYRPNGLRVSKDNELYVCDSNNQRIQVFDLDLNFKRMFAAEKGKDKAEVFDCPSDIDFDSSGRIYVVDCPTHCILVFSHDETHICTIGNTLLGSLKLYRPMNLCIHDDHLFVTNYGSNNVLVLNTKGDMIVSFGSEHLYAPEGITVDDNSFVYVTSHKSQIFVF